tara:strand:- start:1762 stop:2745 length:984 start_codon:yes stop_codon:yes gene_type:complete
MFSTTGLWQEFKMGNVFTFSKGKRLTKADILDGDLNYIGAISDNNGIRQFIDAIPTHKGNCITVNYNGSVGEAFYQKDDFWASDDVNVLRIKEQEFTRNIALFLCTIIKANKYRFSFGRKWTLEKMKETILLLPVNKEGYINWEFMDCQISESLKKTNLENKIKNKNIGKVPPLNTTNWKEFRLIDWFNFKRGTRLTKEKRLDGCRPLVTAGEGNLGVKGFIGNDDLEIFNGGITIDMFCNSYTHVNPFYCDDNVIFIKSKCEISRYTMLFINTILRKDKYRYQYGRQYRQKNLKTHKILLPQDKNGNPDWKFMETYIKSLPYSSNL